MMAARIEVLCCALPSIDSALLARYENLLSEDELNRLRCFRSSAAAKEFLVGRALLRTALAARLHCAPRELQFSKNADGKPSLTQPTSTWQFNLSHSHDWIALALCETANIGVDIESYQRRNNLSAIAQRFFSDDENVRLTRCTASAWLDYFFSVWTLKEAHGKALGCGLSKILSCSSIAVDLSERSIHWQLSGIAQPAENISSWLYKLDAQTALAVVAHGDEFSTPEISCCVPMQSIEPLTLAISARNN